MSLFHYMRLFHFVGIGIIGAMLIAGIVITRHYAKAPDFKSKLLLLKALRPIGLLSPVAILIMIITGIGNMHSLGYGYFTAQWLTIKIGIFLIMATLGVIFGVKAQRRAGLVAQLAQGGAAANSETRLTSLDKQMHLFYLVQAVLMLVILSLSVVRPVG